MDLDFFRNQYNKYQINSMIFNFVILAGFCFIIVFTVNHGINKVEAELQTNEATVNLLNTIKKKINPN